MFLRPFYPEQLNEVVIRGQVWRYLASPRVGGGQLLFSRGHITHTQLTHPQASHEKKKNWEMAGRESVSSFTINKYYVTTPGLDRCKSPQFFFFFLWMGDFRLDHRFPVLQPTIHVSSYIRGKIFIHEFYVFLRSFKFFFVYQFEKPNFYCFFMKRKEI